MIRVLKRSQKSLHFGLPHNIFASLMASEPRSENPLPNLLPTPPNLRSKFLVCPSPSRSTSLPSTCWSPPLSAPGRREQVRKHVLAASRPGESGGTRSACGEISLRSCSRAQTHTRAIAPVRTGPSALVRPVHPGPSGDHHLKPDVRLTQRWTVGRQFCPLKTLRAPRWGHAVRK